MEVKKRLSDKIKVIEFRKEELKVCPKCKNLFIVDGEQSHLNKGCCLWCNEWKTKKGEPSSQRTITSDRRFKIKIKEEI